jgi:hypothetical protein
VNELADFLTFEVASLPIATIPSRITVISGEEYRLIGVVYFGDGHFISRIVSADMNVFAHDGIYGAHATAEGVLNTDISEEELSSCNNKLPSMAFYALD